MNMDAILERLINYFTAENYQTEVNDAKREFFERAGNFDEYSPDFEMKMSQFVDWYLFSRVLSKEGVTPIELALDNVGFAISEQDLPVYKNLRDNKHSLFEFLKVKNKDVYIKDLFTGLKHVIKESPVTVGFNRDEVFEARLIPNGEDGFTFGKSFCTHPAEVRKYIDKEIKKIKALPEEERRAAQEDLLGRLFRMRYKHEQYRHVNIHEIYSNESRLRM